MKNLPDVGSLIMPLLGVIVVIFVAYAGTKWLAKRYTGMYSGKYIQVIERMALGTDKALIIVKIGNKILLLSVSGKEINALSEFSEDELVPIKEKNEEKLGFAGALTAAVKSQSLVSKLFKKNHNSNEDKP